jgi:hypothetical protein
LIRKSSWIIGPVNLGVKLRARRRFHPGNTNRPGMGQPAWLDFRSTMHLPAHRYADVIQHFSCWGIASRFSLCSGSTRPSNAFANP